MFALLYSLFLFSVHPSFAAYELPPVTVEGTPAEILLRDPILPGVSRRTNDTNSSGSVQDQLEQDLALPFAEYGYPGNGGQVRGLGRSAEDTDVEVFGIPLNGPEGLGFDLASFPQFIWRDYRYQLGPSLGSLDPRAVSGTLTLVPWTSTVLATPGFHERGSAFFSTNSIGHVNQLSVGMGSREGESGIAANVGNSSGFVDGPAGSVSVVHEMGNSGTLHFHLLATDLDSVQPGSKAYPSPLARQQTTRMIPAAEAEWKTGTDGIFRSIVYYDWSFIRYDDQMGDVSRDRAIQGGIENAFETGDWRFGASERHTIYRGIDTTAPDEDIVSLQATRIFEVAGWMIEPTLQGLAVTSFGFLPEGSLGIRKELISRGLTFFARASEARKVPSLALRFLSQAGNPNLTPENDLSLDAGFEFELASEKISGTLQYFGQNRSNAFVPVTTVLLNGQPASIYENVGNARVQSLLSELAWKPSVSFALRNAFTVSSSSIDATGGQFPYLASFVDTFSATFSGGEKVEGIPLWEVSPSIRASSSFTDPFRTTGDPAPGFVFPSISASYRLPYWNPPWNTKMPLILSGKIENLNDAPVQYVSGYPFPRTFSLALSGQI
jgi:hypothetical protein